jgi:hypothetical protein
VRTLSELSSLQRDAIESAAGSLVEMALRLEISQRLSEASLDRSNALRMIVQGTRANGLSLTEDAWDEIQAEAIDVLRFLVLVALSEAHQWHRAQLSRALLESPAVRQFAFEHWKKSGPSVRGTTSSGALC